ncbi:MAG: hypothetical protein NUV82_02810 [Candidatus Komeilibacteria bacterium]|nr:hypothetical protein [Candidatus Komeilibacteria bacterium]
MKNKKLAQAIIKRAKADQELRSKVGRGSITDKKWNRVLKLDEQNTEFVEKTVDKYGWPTFDLIGKRASNYFWLLVQHADKNIKLQKRCLLLLKKEVANGQAHPRNYAYLEDRVLAAENKKQIYGTQYETRGNKLVPKPIKNIKKVNQLREAVGVESLDTATKKINSKYKGFLKNRR